MSDEEPARQRKSLIDVMSLTMNGLSPIDALELDMASYWLAGGQLFVAYNRSREDRWASLREKGIEQRIRDAYFLTFNQYLDLKIAGVENCSHPNPEKFRTQPPPPFFLPDPEPPRITSTHALVEVEPRRADSAFVDKQRSLIARTYDALFLRLGRRDGFFCQRCGDMTDLDIDHIRPVILFGTSAMDNLQLLCGSCNSSKGEKIADYRRTLRVRVLSTGVE